MANLLENLFNPNSRTKQFLLLAGLAAGAISLFGFIDAQINLVLVAGITYKQVIGGLLGVLWYWVWQKKL